MPKERRKRQQRLVQQTCDDTLEVVACWLFVWILVCSGTFSLSVATPPSSVSTYSLSAKSQRSLNQRPPIVYTIAGSDSGGGAGIQADLHTMHAFQCYGCSAITCLTAQNSQGVTGVHVPPARFLQQQLETLVKDLPPRAIKIGMLGTRELVEVVGTFLKQLLESTDTKIWIVLDPVMISTSGSKLLADDAISAMIEHIFPLADVVTPNKFEAESLLGHSLHTPQDVEEGARDLLKLQCRSVLIKGGHTLLEGSSSLSSADFIAQTSSNEQSTLEFAQDYLLSSDPSPASGDERVCDASRGVWLRTPRWDTNNTHGTGCTLSSAIASALALGEENRQSSTKIGALSSIHIVDACCLAKAYVSAGIKQGVQCGLGPGSVAQTIFPSSCENFPSIVADPTQISTSTTPTKFCQTKSFSSVDDGSICLGGILPIVNTVEWVKRLTNIPGVTDIQLRIKDEEDPEKIAERVKICQEYCKSAGVRLWINDHWKAAIRAGCFGVHLGQEDLYQCIKAGGLEEILSRGLALGISTHSYGELAVALGVMPSYISMGPVFATSSKKVGFDPQGVSTVAKWRQLIPPQIPLVTIGGINDSEAALLNRKGGANCVAVISAIMGSNDLVRSVGEFNGVMN